MLGRRKFLGTITAGMAAAMVPAGVVTAAGFAALRDRFAALVDSEFRFVSSDGTRLRARLVTIDDSIESGGFEQFSIAFEGDRIDEGAYAVEHDALRGMVIDFTGPGETVAGVHLQRAYFSQAV